VWRTACPSSTMSVEASPLPAAVDGPDGMDGITSTTAADTESTVPAIEGQTPAPPEIPVSETLYIQNLNERIKVPSTYPIFMTRTALNEHIVMKQTLRALFKNYGEVLDVVAHGNLRMRGQAFVSFPDVEAATKAHQEVKGFPLYGKPMVCPPHLSGLSRTRAERNAANHLRAGKE
jgi:U2 small nuclear ribonucleoprotein B''